MDFFRLNGVNGDYIRDASAISQKLKRWRLRNLLPVDIRIYVRNANTNNTHVLTDIPARGTHYVEPHEIRGGDELYTVYMDGAKPIPIMDKFTVHDFHKYIVFGAIAYAPAHEIHTKCVNSDLNGVWIHNKFHFPIDVYYKGNLAAQIRGNNGLGYMGGGASDLFFDNDRQGLNFGDILTFKASLPGKLGREISSIQITDNRMAEMYVGIVNRGFVISHNPDNAVYRIDEPVYTGITFYKTGAGYQTIPTNPNAWL